jgi:hypothetical protein
MPITPSVPLGKPSFLLRSCQVSPPSVLFHNAEPSPPDSNAHGSRTTRHVLA